MTTRTRMNVYFDPELLSQVEALSLRRQVSKSAIVEAAVASFLSGDTSDRLEAAMSRRLDKIGRQIGTLDEDLAVLGETLSLFVHFWLTMTPPLPDSAKQSARIKGNERFEGFMQNLGRRLATGDRFLKELSRDMDSFHDSLSQDQTETDGDAV
ncbi:CopG family transcriptional regulator [Shinella sumterensis]|uniref:CopG family transcriptional regulator n=1 Tax=Brucella haematophila TaxID=419474 RepID=A0ABX1DU54_9HYPH|nr:CopG family transcriptional regulator [Brucella haematophila]NKC04340.1 CopG family transcriptional regulator [Brucella haematophila]TMV06229.1 CopG family transcriptional regulator [Brucella haematophila]WLS06729.1 CopG family transcriptional regulator [Shinella sumterensis]WLS09117.1 CopG family transcriptional regulator [Shinella sumterensis]